MMIRKYPPLFASLPLAILFCLRLLYFLPSLSNNRSYNCHLLFRHHSYLSKFKTLHLQLLAQFDVERQLSSKANLLTKQLMNEALNLEKAQQQQKKNEETLKELENTLGDVNRDVETIQERRAALKAEIHLLENDKVDIENEIKNKEVKAKEKIIPEIERVTR